MEVVIAVDIKETPSYKNPLKKKYEDPSKEGHYPNQFYEPLRQQKGPQTPIYFEDSQSPSHSPVLIHGVRWVGELTGLVQVFAKDPETGKIVAKTKKVVSTENI